MAMDDSDEDQLPNVNQIMKCTSKHNLDIGRSFDNEPSATIHPPHHAGSKAAPIVLDSSDEEDDTQRPMK